MKDFNTIILFYYINKAWRIGRSSDCLGSHAGAPGSNFADPIWVFLLIVLVARSPLNVTGDHVDCGIVEFNPLAVGAAYIRVFIF